MASVHLFTQQTPTDPTERAMFDAFNTAKDFRHALVDATTATRVLQIQTRLEAIIAELDAVHHDARLRADALCQDVTR